MEAMEAICLCCLREASVLHFTNNVYTGCEDVYTGCEDVSPDGLLAISKFVDFHWNIYPVLISI